MEADFSGYATKAGLKCSDGRTIMPDAFKHQDKVRVPLVWQHNHKSADQVLGHAILEARPDGMYAYGFFNETPQGKSAKLLVQHKDVEALSIWANNLTEKTISGSKQVFHGMIRELSLVLSGANPGAKIDNVILAHADGSEDVLEDEAVIYTGLPLEHENMKEEPEKKDETAEHADSEDEDQTVQDVYDSLTDEQKEVVHYMIGAALEEAAVEHTEKKSEEDLEHKEGTAMTKRNVFEQNGGTKDEKPVLSHADMISIVEDAKKNGSLKQAVEAYALQHGIDNIDVLFPDARSVDATPQLDTRRTGWVQGVLDGVKHSPFSRVKTQMADLTLDQARAKGYVKGNLKKDEWFAVFQRVTTPTTIYKKQSLDRDDILDITDFDVVAWIQQEMRFMLNEEIAGAILVGDGRDVEDDDKIKEPANTGDGAGIRPIANENELFAATITLPSTATGNDIVDGIVQGMTYYKGSGTPTFYTTLTNLTTMLLLRDTLGRRLYRTAADIAAELSVSSIVTVDAPGWPDDLYGIVVNLSDYTVGADKGGEINFFDDFDIDYNKEKYLIETRISGGLTKIRSAVVVRMAAVDAVKVTPVAPSVADNVVTVATTAHVTYINADTGATLTTGAPVTLTADSPTLRVTSVAADGYYLDNTVQNTWLFEFDHSS